MFACILDIHLASAVAGTALILLYAPLNLNFQKPISYAYQILQTITESESAPYTFHISEGRWGNNI